MAFDLFDAFETLLYLPPDPESGVQLALLRAKVIRALALALRNEMWLSRASAGRLRAAIRCHLARGEAEIRVPEASVRPTTWPPYPDALRYRSTESGLSLVDDDPPGSGPATVGSERLAQGRLGLIRGAVAADERGWAVSTMRGWRVGDDGAPLSPSVAYLVAFRASMDGAFRARGWRVLADGPARTPMSSFAHCWLGHTYVPPVAIDLIYARPTGTWVAPGSDLPLRDTPEGHCSGVPKLAATIGEIPWEMDGSGPEVPWRRDRARDGEGPVRGVWAALRDLALDGNLVRRILIRRLWLTTLVALGRATPDHRRRPPFAPPR